MARFDIGELEAVAGRTVDYEWAAYEGDGRTAVAIDASDQLRFKLSATEDDSTPSLDLTKTANGNGSVVTVTTVGSAGVTPASGTVRLAQADTALLSGRYYWELNLVDNSETAPADAIKPICRGTIVFRPSQGGTITL
jgi:hypothetical protein